MAPSPPRLRILSVGGNATSAFLSWRLQATNACDVTLVWKNGYEAVAQYGISFKSQLFGNERFKPRHVVPSPEDAIGQKAPFDYVLLCVKALPDVYDLAAVIESVVTPQHTCIIVNTTHSLGIESHLEQRFPTNVVLSLVSGADVVQLGLSEFEHSGATDVWVGPANQNENIPPSIQNDMAEALAMTLSTGQVVCSVAHNIRQQQFERMIGPIAFHPSSVLFETPVHADLIEKIGVRSMISDTIDELLNLAQLQGCVFDESFKDETMKRMTAPQESHSVMYQDFTSRRPMEVETYLGSPIKLAAASGIAIPRIETLYALLHHCNIINQQKPQKSTSPNASLPNTPGAPPVRMSSHGPPRAGMNGGSMRGGRGHPMRRGGGPPMHGPPMNGYPPRHPNGYNRPMQHPNQPSRRTSMDGDELGEEFSHLVMYDDMVDGSMPPGYHDMPNGGPPNPSELALREKELALRQRELQLREQEYQMRRGPRRQAPSRAGFDEEEDDDDYFDPMAGGTPRAAVDPDKLDMMSVTSRRTRKAPSHSQIRQNPESGAMGGRLAGMRSNRVFSKGTARNRTSSHMIDQNMRSLHDDLMSDPMMGYSSNRYGAVDRKEMQVNESRTNSLTAARLNELGGAGGSSGMHGAYPTPVPRRTSQSPGLHPGMQRQVGRPSPTEEGFPSQGQRPGGGRPSPPGQMRQPVPRHPPGQGNSVAPQQVEQYAGVSKSLHSPPVPYKGQPPSQNAMRSLTGSASASVGSGDSVHDNSDPSNHSSQSSLGPRMNNLRYPAGHPVGAH